MDRRGALAVLGGLLCAPTVFAAEPVLPAIDDLRRLAGQVGRYRMPLLLFFTTAGCPSGTIVRRSYLAPRRTQMPAESIIREVDLSVATPSETLIMHKGSARLSYSCTPVCERTLRAGDNNDSFTELQSQVSATLDMGRAQASR